MVVLIAFCVLIFIIGLIWIYRKYRVKRQVGSTTFRIMVGCITVAAFIAFFIAGALPPMTESLTITALNEKTADAEDSEIYISSFLQVDGKEFPVVFSDGYWYERGENYGWIREDRGGHPDGLTQKVEIQMPVGEKRSVSFSAGTWRGKALLEMGDWSQEIDTYAIKDTTLKVSIPSSSGTMIWTQRLILCGTAAIVFIVLSILMLWLICKAECEPERWQGFVKRTWDKWIYAGCGILCLLFLINNASLQSFWNDEIYQLGFINEHVSWSEILRYRLVETSPPLYSLFMAIWYRLVPYGQEWLLLPSAVSVAIGIYFIGLTGAQIRSKKTGVIAALLAGTSTALMLEAGLELRSNAFMFLFAATTLYLYVVRYRQMGRETKGLQVLLGISMLLLVFSHYFGVVFCGALFIADAYLFIKKKIKARCIISYLIAAIPFLIWLIISILWGAIANGFLEDYWPSTPTWRTILDLLQYFTGAEMLGILLFVAGIFLIFYRSIRKSRQNQFDFSRDYLPTVMVIVVIFVIGAIYLYSVSVNPAGSMFVQRYFLCIMPCVFIIMALALELGFLLFAQLLNRKKAATLFVALCSIFFICWGAIGYDAVLADQSKYYQPFREACNWLYAQPDIYKSDTVIVTTINRTEVDGLDYYLTRQGQREEIDVVPQTLAAPGFEVEGSGFNLSALEGKKIIYVLDLHVSRSIELKAFLEENYEKVSENSSLHITKYESKEAIESEGEEE